MIVFSFKKDTYLKLHTIKYIMVLGDIHRLIVTMVLLIKNYVYIIEL